MLDELLPFMLLEEISNHLIGGKRQILSADDMNIVIIPACPDQFEALQDAFNLAVMAPLYVYRLLYEMNIFAMDNLLFDTAFLST